MAIASIKARNSCNDFMTKTWLEFHDSDLLPLRRDGAALLIELRGYVHRWELASDQWKGTGWMQPILIRIVTDDDLKLESPMNIADGRLKIGDTTHKNLVPIPLEAMARVELWLHLWSGEEVKELTIAGSSVTVTGAGEMTYVEDLPAD